MEWRRPAKQAEKNASFFFTPPDSLLLPLLSSSLPRAEPSRSLALFRTLADMSRASAARSALRALAATATGAGVAAPVRAAFFLHGIFPRSLSSRFARCSACDSGDVLRCLSSSSQRRRSSRFFSPDCHFAVRSGPREGEMKQKGPPWPAKARAEKHASAFSLARAVSHFFLFFDFSSSSSPLSLSASLLDRSSVRTAARALARALVRGQERACFREFPSSQRLFFFSFQLNEKKKKYRHRPPSPLPPPPLAAPSRPRRRRASPLSAPSPRGASPPGRRRPTLPPRSSTPRASSGEEIRIERGRDFF